MRFTAAIDFFEHDLRLQGGLNSGCVITRISSVRRCHAQDVDNRDPRYTNFLLGQSGFGTTETYLAAPTLDELSAAVSDFAFGAEPEQTFYHRVAEVAKAEEAP